MTKPRNRPGYLAAAAILLAAISAGCQQSGLPPGGDASPALVDGAIPADANAQRDLTVGDLSATAPDAAAIDAAGTCPPSESPCETDGGNICSTLRTLTDCGICGKVCAPPHATGTCDSGSCSIKTCDPGWGDCNGDVEDGCEVDLHADSRNCGKCGIVCYKGFGCQNGFCFACCDVDPFENCSGICANGCDTNVLNNPKNCNACGHVCPPNAPNCIRGQCTR